MCLRVSKIRKDPKINTIGLPVLITSFMNADFDGDELNIILLTDQHLIDAAQDLSPHKGVLDLNIPYKVAGDLAFPAPLVSTIAE